LLINRYVLSVGLVLSENSGAIHSASQEAESLSFVVTPLGGRPLRILHDVLFLALEVLHIWRHILQQLTNKHFDRGVSLSL
jgi:hypothetical protein